MHIIHRDTYSPLFGLVGHNTNRAKPKMSMIRNDFEHNSLSHQDQDFLTSREREGEEGSGSKVDTALISASAVRVTRV